MRQYRMKTAPFVLMGFGASLFLVWILFSHSYCTPGGVEGLIGSVVVLMLLPTQFMWRVSIDSAGLASGYCFSGRFKKTVQIDFENIASVRMGADKKSVFIYSTSNRRSVATGREAIVLKENLVNRSELLGLLLEKVPASKVVDSAVYEKASGMKL